VRVGVSVLFPRCIYTYQIESFCVFSLGIVYLIFCLFTKVSWNGITELSLQTLMTACIHHPLSPLLHTLPQSILSPSLNHHLYLILPNTPPPPPNRRQSTLTPTSTPTPTPNPTPPPHTPPTNRNPTTTTTTSSPPTYTSPTRSTNPRRCRNP